jgi:hypothetical protein
VRNRQLGNAVGLSDHPIIGSPDHPMNTKGTACTVPFAPSSKVELIAHQFVQLLGIEADHHLIANNQRRCRAALVLANQIIHRLRIAGYITIFKLDTSRREVGLCRAARRSTRLREDDDLFRHAR